MPSMGTPALRFMEAMPIAPVLSKPIASGPPVAASGPEVAEVNLANNQAAASTPPMPLPAQPAQLAPVTPSAAPQPEQPATPTPKPQPIIPDDTRRKLQSQDFLPLFRFPGPNDASEDVSVPAVPTPPAPGVLPPSSATYQQR